jgi:hypothetical protein
MSSFLAGLIAGSIVVEGSQWLKRWISASDPDRKGIQRLVPAVGIEPTA